MKVLSGLVASPGAAHGNAILHQPSEITIDPQTVQDVSAEQAKARHAMTQTVQSLARTTERVRISAGPELAHIFRSQQTIAEDESIVGEITSTIAERHCTGAEAIDETLSEYVRLFSELPEDGYNAQRVADVEDVRRRALRIFLELPEADLSSIPSGSIVVAEELFPSDTALIDTSKVVGIVTERGGLTSHVAILSKSLGIPAAVGVKEACSIVSTGDGVSLDAVDQRTAYVLVAPEDAAITTVKEIAQRYSRYCNDLASAVGSESRTLDGHTVQVSANIGNARAAVAVSRHGAASIGLFRTEFLYLNASTSPDEETQFEAYRTAVEAIAPGMVIFRTMDIGGDKAVPYLSIPREDNPFLGLRALRVSFRDTDSFKTQLRAILRASAYGNAKIMFPMVGSVREIVRARKLLDEARDELREANTTMADHVDVGVMIEVPAAVFMAEEIAQLVDFFSVGTNDLTQYLLAADRTNEAVSEYYQPLHPAVLRALRVVVKAARKRGIWTGICGELAGMPQAIPLLVGLGIDELSMATILIPEAIHTIRRQNFAEVSALADRACACRTVDEVGALLKERPVGFHPATEGRSWAVQSAY